MIRLETMYVFMGTLSQTTIMMYFMEQDAHIRILYSGMIEQKPYMVRVCGIQIALIVKFILLFIGVVFVALKNINQMKLTFPIENFTTAIVTAVVYARDASIL